VGDWEVTLEPTITETGKRIKKCSRCKHIIESEILPMLDPEVGAYELLATNAVVPKYYLRTDSTGELTEGTYEDIMFVTAGYLKNNNNIITPVLYGTDPAVSLEPYLDDVFFYVGQETIFGIVYDKWKKIEKNGGSYTWTSSMSYYIYTNVVVSNNRFANNIFAKSVSGTVTVP
jgi:hypothetical protein